MSKASIANDFGTIEKMWADTEFVDLRRRIYEHLVRYKYSYNFTWLGRAIIQMPDDILAIQELIFQIKPDLIVETGVAHGGSMALSASMLDFLGDEGEVIGIDIEIRPHNRKALEEHPLFTRMHLIEGSSVDQNVYAQVSSRAKHRKRVMVLLDSDHTHDHVLHELRLYSALVTKSSYLVVFDTVVDELSASAFPDRPWGPGNSPKSAIDAFLRECHRFEIDWNISARLPFSSAPSGFLKCVE